MTDATQLPADWRRPAVEFNPTRSSPHLLISGLAITSSPEIGQLIRAGQSIENLSLHIQPPPQDETTVSYMVEFLNKAWGPFTVPVGVDGVAQTFVLIDQQFDRPGTVRVIWTVGLNRMVAWWPLRN